VDWNTVRSTVFLGLLGLTLLPGCEACDAQPLGVLPDPGSIVGRVCDPGGEDLGLFGARVAVIQEFGDGTKGEVAFAITEADGSFVVEDVPPGTYELEVERGSFSTTVENVVVVEEEETSLGPDTCVAPNVVNMIVFDGHDQVELVLNRLGFDDFEVVETFHREQDRPDNTPSWLTEAFQDYDDFSDKDIIFINCGEHEWALDEAAPQELEQAFENLRTFVRDGGSIYMSDWAYDLMEQLYPDAVDWYDDDGIRNEAEVSIDQFFVGDVVDQVIASTIGRERASLRFELGRVALPVDLGPGSRALITAEIEALDRNDLGDSNDDESFTLTDVPVLLEHRPTDLPPTSDGRIIFTAFHNGDSNTADMDEVLRAIVFSL
jgi:SAM-dependent methyltransferase